MLKKNCLVVERTLGFLGDSGSIPTCCIWGKRAMTARSPVDTMDRGPESEPAPGFHPAVTLARFLVWRQYGFRGKAATKSDNQRGSG
ncbi:hypothetical protein Hanom_Chr02g00097411 [Helianthus anomalus]